MRKNKSERVILALLIIATIAVILFVFSNSLCTASESSKQSNTIKAFIMPVLEVFVGKGNVTSYLVRKLAHVVEFSFIGLMVCALYLYTTKKSFSLCPLLLSMAVALFDETIQLFSDGRSAQIKDVWIDMIGVCLGYVACLILFSIIHLFKIKRKSNTILSKRNRLT